jgi:predicted RNA binding protein YcfA (HicA-like mRNA interferase family)
MPRRYPPLTPDDVIAILLARGFSHDHTTGSHAVYQGMIKGKRRSVTVDLKYREFGVRRLKDMMAQAGLSRKEFYGSTKATAKKLICEPRSIPSPKAMKSPLQPGGSCYQMTITARYMGGLH